jgi:hypothetical protein
MQYWHLTTGEWRRLDRLPQFVGRHQSNPVEVPTRANKMPSTLTRVDGRRLVATIVSKFNEQPVGTLPGDYAASGVTSSGHVYAFEELPDGRVRLVWDGSANQPFDTTFAFRGGTERFWSPTGAHFAYVGSRDGRPMTVRGAPSSRGRCPYRQDRRSGICLPRQADSE